MGGGVPAKRVNRFSKIFHFPREKKFADNFASHAHEKYEKFHFTLFRQRMQDFREIRNAKILEKKIRKRNF